MFQALFLNDIDVDSDGNFYITDTGNFETSGVVFKMNLAGDISVLFDETTENNKAPNGVLHIGNNKLLLVDWGGELFEANTLTKKISKKFYCSKYIRTIRIHLYMYC